ncbi:hypothetical protein SCALIN_C34_0003 [Candidatus Scalindua japonica]|uniref:Lcl C-terminal domain-containing protein n=1 Tax=Candidatus Scalindua japonica TaxID=1284222 RepID=A0A286U2T9_9BACT|nr:DUF1566 domain-containing protein [Candidatus Scalindua japonica]GAX62452.1 hypothetical protein SCALIN_C34_0003 [Candidatus Scalindua japonica]
MVYIVGERKQQTFLPPSIDEYIKVNDPVRVYNAFIMISVVIPILIYARQTFGEADNKEIKASIVTQTEFRLISKENFFGKSVVNMLKDNSFYDRDWNSSASGFPNDYQLQSNGKVVLDRASGLMWQQSGSAGDVSFDEAERYVLKLNSDQFAGYNDWRLPTLEEAMSLMESTEKSGGLHIAAVFDNTRRWIWTSDKNNASLPWIVNFVSGNCYTYVNDYFDFTSDGYIRSVR